MSIDDDPMLEDDYDEEADSDFLADGANDDDLSVTSDDEDGVTASKATQIHQKRQKAKQDVGTDGDAVELDSGDEATIKEQKKAKRKQRKRGEDVDEDSGNEDGGWRAKTRAMRERDRDEKKRNKLAKIEGSTIDVDKIWEDMNRAGPLPPLRIEGIESPIASPSKKQSVDPEHNKENTPIALKGEEMITIKRKFKFAGEVHIEEKIVPKSSAEARLWLAQQETKPQPATGDNAGNEGALVEVKQRPLRKISRFDPNYSNIDAFKVTFARTSNLASNVPGTEEFKGPKLNVVEKSKMDWASHVDAEGLKDELDEHAKAKEGYHSRMDFLGQVEVRREEEAKAARLKKV